VPPTDNDNTVSLRFQEASGLYGYIRENECNKMDVPRPMDLTTEVVTLLEKLMLTQAQVGGLSLWRSGLHNMDDAYWAVEYHQWINSLIVGSLSHVSDYPESMAFSLIWAHLSFSYCHTHILPSHASIR